jgi:Asp/Glu/hydantoin racemase
LPRCAARTPGWRGFADPFGELDDRLDAVIVGCFDDPGVDALRELATRTLVVGPGAAAMHVAGLLGGSFGIVTVPNPTATRKLVLTERLDARPPFGGSESLESSAAAAATLTPPCKRGAPSEKGKRHLQAHRITRGVSETNDSRLYGGALCIS